MGNQLQKPLQSLQDCCTLRDNKELKESCGCNGSQISSHMSARSSIGLAVNTPKRNLDKILKTLVKKSISEKAGLIDLNQIVQIEEQVKPLLEIYVQDLSKIKDQNEQVNVEELLVTMGAYLSELSIIIQNMCQTERLKEVTRHAKSTVSASPASLSFESPDQMISSQINRKYHRQSIQSMLDLITEKSENEVINKMTQILKLDPQTMDQIQKADDDEFQEQIADKKLEIQSKLGIVQPEYKLLKYKKCEEIIQFIRGIQKEQAIHQFVNQAVENKNQSDATDEKQQTPLPKRGKSSELGGQSSQNRRKLTNSAKLDKNGKLTPCTPLKLSKVFDFDKKTADDNREDAFNQVNIDHFEVWDWVEIKYNGLKEEQVMESLEHYGLFIEAGIQESEDNASSSNFTNQNKSSHIIS